MPKFDQSTRNWERTKSKSFPNKNPPGKSVNHIHCTITEILDWKNCITENEFYVSVFVPDVMNQTVGSTVLFLTNLDEEEIIRNVIKSNIEKFEELRIRSYFTVRYEAEEKEPNNWFGGNLVARRVRSIIIVRDKKISKKDSWRGIFNCFRVYTEIEEK